MVNRSMIFRITGITVIVLVVISLIALMGGKITQQSILGEQSISISGKTYLRGVPILSNAECFADTTLTRITTPTPLPSTGQVYDCPSGDNCQLKLAYPKPGVLSDQNGIFYTVCDINAKECTIKGAKSYATPSDLTPQSMVSSSSSGLYVGPKIRSNQKIFVQYADLTTVSRQFQTGLSGAQVGFEYNPLKMRVTSNDPFLGQKFITEGCRLSTLAEKAGYNPEEFILDASDPKIVSKLCDSELCLPGGIANWVVRVDLVQSFGQGKNPVTYNGNQYFCQMSVEGGNLWNVGFLEVDELRYAYPQSKTSNKVACCPGTTLGGQTCTDDFKIAPRTDPSIVSCVSDSNCLQAGTFTLAKDGSLIREACNLQTKTCFVAETKAPECSPFKDCAKGYDCVEGFKCVKQEDTSSQEDKELECGILQQKVREDAVHCGTFCKLGLISPVVTGTKETCATSDLLQFIIIGAIALGALYFIAQPKKITPEIIRRE